MCMSVVQQEFLLKVDQLTKGCLNEIDYVDLYLIVILSCICCSPYSDSGCCQTGGDCGNTVLEEGGHETLSRNSDFKPGGIPFSPDPLRPETYSIFLSWDESKVFTCNSNMNLQ